MSSDQSLFGTDGIRGKAGEWPLTPEFTLCLGRAIGQAAKEGSEQPVVVLGRDTRRSGPLLESSLLAGILAQGVDAMVLGPFTTPGVSYLTTQMGATLGVVVSASHNPYWDNGIKVFEDSGFKASDDLETYIEDLALQNDQSWQTNDFPGVDRQIPDEGQSYAKHLVEVFGGPGALSGLRVVLDCANGAATLLTPDVFRRLGAEVVALNVWPNGTNINVDCGTEGDGPRRAGQAVLAAGADVGFVFDGDADRCKFVDETGVERDGDYILAIMAREMQAAGTLAGDTVVSTIMANLGLDISLRQIGVSLERTRVGDRWVSQRMREKGYVLGGEQSGHIIMFENGLTTGDGLYTALWMSQLLLRKRPQRFSELACFLTKVPQVLDKAPVPAKPSLETLSGVQAQIERSHELLGPDTLINVRYSGTEPVVRVMIQGAGQPLDALKRETQQILQTIVAEIPQAQGN
ncbi:MAG: phosphoglucosamine mutase [Chloroflexota bacterium]|nr:phosphoglucosamine mutase [Chloroflexota bacterium]